MKNFSRLAIAAAFAVSTTAFADTITLTYDSPIYAHGSDGVNLAGTRQPPIRPRTRIPASAPANSARTTSRVTGSPHQRRVWSTARATSSCTAMTCSRRSAQAVTYTYTVNYTGALAHTLDFLGAVNSVLNGASGTDQFAWLHPTRTPTSRPPSSSASGKASTTPIPTSASLPARSRRAASTPGLRPSTRCSRRAVSTTNSLSQSLTMVLRKRHQPGPDHRLAPEQRQHNFTPEPGSLALLAAGLIAAGVARRKRKG